MRHGGADGELQVGPPLGSGRRGIVPVMATDPNHLERLVQELAQLGPAERARVMAEATRRANTLRGKQSFRRPTLSGGIAWIGREQTREELYGDDGRRTAVRRNTMECLAWCQRGVGRSVRR